MFGNLVSSTTQHVYMLPRRATSTWNGTKQDRASSALACVEQLALPSRGKSIIRLGDSNDLTTLVFGAAGPDATVLITTEFNDSIQSNRASRRSNNTSSGQPPTSRVGRPHFQGGKASHLHASRQPFGINQEWLGEHVSCHELGVAVPHLTLATRDNLMKETHINLVSSPHVSHGRVLSRRHHLNSGRVILPPLQFEFSAQQQLP